RAGDYFTLSIQGKTGTREARVTIGKDETLRSLALKINNGLLFDGKAKTLGVKGGQGLSIAVNEGVKVQLIAGPKDFDALAGLWLSPQTLGNDGKTTAGKAAAAAGPQTVGLGLDAKLSLLNESDARHSQTLLLAAQSLIKQAYTTLNAPPGSAASTQPAGATP